MIARMRRRWPPGIRTQLALLYTAVFALLFLIFGGAYYGYLRNTLQSSFDQTLQLRTEMIASGISYDNGAISIQDVTGELPDLNNNATGGPQDGPTTNATNSGTAGAGGSGAQSNVNFSTLVRILDAHGHMVYASPGFRSLAPPATSISSALHGATTSDTITARDGTQIRLYSAPLSDNGTVYGVIQVGEPLASLTTTLRSVTITWLGIAPFVLLLSALGSYWLARRAFRPMLRLTRTARSIEAEDLHQRVHVPRAKDEIRDLALTLNAMIARLDAAFTQQRRFVADASHELRTPVAAIRSLTDVALEQEMATREEYAAALRDINAEAGRLGQLINDLLALARADEGKTLLDRDLVRLDTLAGDVVAVMEPLATERGIQVETQTAECVIVIGDEARLIQVVMNLLDNAIRYTNAGGAVRVRVAAEKGQALLTVRDTGIGIAAEHLPHLFERFYRADPARSRAEGGSGLGLAIVEWVAHAHGGTIHVESKEGQGSTFTVALPLAP